MANQIALASNQAPLSVFSSISAFEDAQRLIKPLITSDLVPVAYRGFEKTGNALIALDMANRMGISALVVMQNLHVIEGRPSWSSKFVISALGSCGLFSPLRWKIEDLGEVEAEKVEWSGPKGQREKRIIKTKVHDKRFTAYAIEKATGEILEGPPVTFSMAIAEGWYHRPGSKWITMPDLMGRYRSASMFGGLYAPHILNGMPTDDEILDITDYQVIDPAPAKEDAPATDAKPAGRPSGLHAAMKTENTVAKPKPKAKAEPKPEERTEKVEEAEIVEENNDDFNHDSDDDKMKTSAENDDVFGSPDDDDDNYEPA